MKFPVPMVGQLYLVGPGEAAPGVADLRARVLIEEAGYLNSRSELEDSFAEQTGHVLVNVGGTRCDAMLRIVHSGPEGFELEHYVDPRPHVSITDRTLEISELIVAPGSRASILSMVLALGLCGYLKMYQPDVVIAGATVNTAELYRKLGMTIRRDIVYRGAWNTDLFLCYSSPASYLQEHILSETPAMYSGFVRDFLDRIEPQPV